MQNPKDISPEAKDAPIPGRGSSKDESDPFWSLLIGEEDNSDGHQEDDTSEVDTDTSMLDEEEDREPMKTSSNKESRNTPKTRPGIQVASLNMRGHQKDSKDKLKMVIDWLWVNWIAILALQETHMTDEALEDLSKRYRNIKFFGSGLPSLSRGSMFIISNRAGSPQSIRYTTFKKGRVGMISLDYRGQELNIVNVYMPNQKPQQREALENLQRDLEEKQDLMDTELMIVGDWNFVGDKVDRSPQHNNDRRVTSKMAKLKTAFDLVDGWKVANPNARSFSWEGRSGSERRRISSRID